MNISNFEEFLDVVILERGWDYFCDGHVEKITEKEEGIFEANVVGSDDYTVRIQLEEDGTILFTSCDCPYDWGEFCKHVAATFYAVRDIIEDEKKQPQKIPAQKKKKKELKDILNELSKEQLVRIILDFTNEYPHLEKKLLFQFSSEEDEIANSKKFIRESINRAKRRGFIDWNRVSDALYGAEVTLDKARSKMENGEADRAIYLALTVLSFVVDMLDYSDDSGGEAGIVIDECLDIINEAVSAGMAIFNETMRKKVFDAIFKEAKHRRYDDMVDWRHSLLESLTYFCDNDILRTKLEDYLELNLSKQSSKYSFYDDYGKTELRLIQLKIMELWDPEEKTLQFIYKYINTAEFREKAVLFHLDNREYEKVIALCEDAEKKELKHRDLSIWKKFKLQAYVALGDIENQREVTLQLLYDDDFSYYGKLKNLYQPDEWSSILVKILAHFENDPYGESTYLDILLEEKLYEKLLQYCQEKEHLIEWYYKYLLNDYYDEVEKIYRKHIENRASEGSNRSNYRAVCYIIRKYLNIFGREIAQELIHKLKETYHRRPAFLDELSKI